MLITQPHWCFGTVLENGISSGMGTNFESPPSPWILVVVWDRSGTDTPAATLQAWRNPCGSESYTSSQLSERQATYMTESKSIRYARRGWWFRGLLFLVGHDEGGRGFESGGFASIAHSVLATGRQTQLLPEQARDQITEGREAVQFLIRIGQGRSSCRSIDPSQYQTSGDIEHVSRSTKNNTISRFRRGRGGPHNLEGVWDNYICIIRADNLQEWQIATTVFTYAYLLLAVIKGTLKHRCTLYRINKTSGSYSL